jgi:hypothetical protein
MGTLDFARTVGPGGWSSQALLIFVPPRIRVQGAPSNLLGPDAPAPRCRDRMGHPPVEVESEWTASRREQMGLRPKVRMGPIQRSPP